MGEANFGEACAIDVLFFDTVNFTNLSETEQLKVVQHLQEIVLELPEVRAKREREELVLIPTGDGMAVVFFGNGEGPLRSAIELSLRLRAHAKFEVRMGLHSGPAFRYRDVNGEWNVSGEGINLASRVMDLGEGGHILLSRAAVDRAIGSMPEMASSFRDLGETAAKHGLRLNVFRFHGDGVGNEDVPLKIRRDLSWRRPVGMWLGKQHRNPFLGGFQLLAWALFCPVKWRDAVKAMHPNLPVDFGPSEVTPALIRQNPELLRALIAGYVLLPFFISLTVWLALSATGNSIPLHRAAAAAAVAVAAPLFSLALGFGAGLIFCAFTGWGTLLRYTTLAFAGPVWEGVALGLMAGVFAVALLNVFELGKVPGVRREAMAMAVGVFSNLALGAVAMFAVGRLLDHGMKTVAGGTGDNIGEIASSGWFGVVTAGVSGAAMIWLMLAGAIILRRGRWAYGATAGGIAAGALFAALVTMLLYLQNSGATFASDAAQNSQAPTGAALAVGIGGTMAMVAGRSLSFALAERMGGVVAAISSITVIDGLVFAFYHLMRHDLHPVHALILVPVVGAHILNRRRSQRAHER